MVFPSRSSDPSDKGKNIIELSDDEDDDDIDSSHSTPEDVVEVQVQTRANKKKKKKKPTLQWEIWEEETEQWLDQHMTEDIDLDNLNEVVTETVEPSPDLIMPLLRYQKEWLFWGLKQEESSSRGGILADEMGMGKTIQAIALVLAKRALFREMGQPVDRSTSLKVKGTLVICPLVAVMQWVSEIERFTAKGSNKILVYHGSKREKTFREFSECDFIITTYSIVEIEFRNYKTPPKDKCGPEFVKTTKNEGKFGVLLSALKEDLDERKCEKERESNNNNTKCILHSVIWDRIILDEAHYIKNKRSKTTRAVLALESSYKWALSGTPLQNNVGDLYSLVRFLQVTPYSYYLCKDCDCKMLEYVTNNFCPNCLHFTMRHFFWWNKHIATPITKSGNTDDGKRAVILLKNKILKSLLLRRTKKGKAADLTLPHKIITLRRDYLNVTEQDYYTPLHSDAKKRFNRYVEAGNVMRNYAHIFDLLMRLRMAVNHPYLVTYSKSGIKRKENETKVIDEQDCGVCHDVAEDHVVTSCKHVFCKSCLVDFCSSYGQPICPSCSYPITVDFSQNNDQEDHKTKMTLEGFKSTSILNRINLKDFHTSTKIEALKEEIRWMVERDGSAKGIVFSQFTSFLDLIKYSLQKSGVKCVQLDGSMNMASREAVITKFTEDEELKILLMSLKAGGVALNLTVASNVFLMEPWWNPAVEQQAQDRIHRIGQYKPIRVVRFVIENTIEEAILNLQEKKETVFEGTVGGSNEALGKLTMDDLRLLFA